MPECSICHCDVFEKPLYRNNPKGEVGDWRCEEHLDRTPNKEVKEIVDIIHNN